jgi:hypothetical protein
MTKFRITSIFRLPSRREFVFAGEIAEGRIEAGMVVRVPLQEELYSCVPILAVEYIRNTFDPRECVGLRCSEKSTEDIEFYSELCPPGTVVDVRSDA